MATNLKNDNDRIIGNVAATHPATPTSGSPVLLGTLPGVALTDEGEGGNDSGKITMDTGGVYTLSVVGEGTAAVAVAEGDRIYYDNGVLNKDSTNGTAYGWAVGGTVSSGGTTAIDVKIQGA